MGRKSSKVAAAHDGHDHKHHHHHGGHHGHYSEEKHGPAEEHHPGRSDTTSAAVRIAPPRASAGEPSDRGDKFVDYERNSQQRLQAWQQFRRDVSARAGERYGKNEEGLFEAIDIDDSGRVS